MADPETLNLDDRIAAALTSRIPSTDADDILDGARRRLRRIEEKLANATREAESPTLPAQKVRAARDRLDDLTFDRRRAAKSIEALEARVIELRADEERNRTRDQETAAIAERDALALRLQERIPAIYAELTGLLAEIVANDARLPAGALSAEAKARGCPGHFYWPNGGGPVSRLTKVQLPNFAESQLAWPPKSRPLVF